MPNSGCNFTDHQYWLYFLDKIHIKHEEEKNNEINNNYVYS